VNVFSTCFLFDQSKDELGFLRPLNLNTSSFIFIAGGDEKATIQLILEAFDVGCQAFFVTTSMTLFFLAQHRNIQDQSLQRNAITYLVALPDFQKSDTIFQQILDAPAIERIENTLILRIKNESIELMTNKVAGISKEYMLLDEYFPLNQSFKQNVILFPEKWKNLEQRPISLVFFEFPPYNVWKPVEEGEGFATEIGSKKNLNIELGGTEGLLAKDFMRKLNFTYYVSLGESWGKIDENGTNGTGVLGSILNHEFDFGLAAVFPWYPDTLFVAFSQYVRKSSVTCLVPRPRPLDLWKIIFLPFSYDMWMATFVSIMVSIFSIRFIKRSSQKIMGQRCRESSSLVVLNVLGVMLMQSFLIKTKNVSYLLIISTLLLFGLIIGSAYSGGLASVMNVPQ
jgi:hypothetical protein